MSVFKTTRNGKPNICALVAFFCLMIVIFMIFALVFLNVSKATNTAVDFLQTDSEFISEYGTYLRRSLIITGEIRYGSSIEDGFEDGFANLNYSITTDTGKYDVQINLIKSDCLWTVVDYSVSPHK